MYKRQHQKKQERGEILVFPRYGTGCFVKQGGDVPHQQRISRVRFYLFGDVYKRQEKKIATLESERQAFVRGKSSSRYKLEQITEKIEKNNDLIRRLSLIHIL